MGTEVIMLPVSAGDATLIVSSDGGSRHAILIDAGLDEHEAVSYLQSIGIFHLDLIVLSHPDMDHLGGLPAIIKSRAMSVDRIWCFDLDFLREFIITGKIPRPKPATREVVYDYFVRSTLDEFSQILKTANVRGIQVLQVSEGYKLSLGGLLLEVLYPPQRFYDSLSNPKALKEMLVHRNWPKEWTTEGKEAGGPKARQLSSQERKERLTEMFENPKIQEDGPLLTDLEISQRETTEGDEDPEKLPWKMVGTLYNNLSIVVKVTVLGGISGPSLLFTGDLSDWTTLILRQWPNLRADVLKVPHHGSDGVSFDSGLVRRVFWHWIEFSKRFECCDAGRLAQFMTWNRATWLRSPKGFLNRDPVSFLKELVNPAHLLVFPYPRYELPSMKLEDFHSSLIANRFERDSGMLRAKSNPPSPARISLGFEQPDINEVTP